MSTLLLKGKQSSGLITLGQLSERAGINRHTLRYYSEQGLLQIEERTESNYKLFNADLALKQIDFIKKAQRINFSLDEIKSLLEVRGKNHPCEKVRSLLNQKINEIDQRINEFQLMKSFLTEVETKWKHTENCDFSQENNYSICKLIEDI